MEQVDFLTFKKPCAPSIDTLILLSHDQKSQFLILLKRPTSLFMAQWR